MAGYMAKTKAALGSNLFAVDLDGIRAILAEANAPLLGRVENLAAALERVPRTLDTDALIERARTYQAQLLAARKELRRARLADGKPFREADGVVKAFFAAADQGLLVAERELRRRLTEAALRSKPPAAPPTPTAPRPLVESFDGRRLGEGQVLAPAPAPPAAPAAAATIPLRWEVAAVERWTVDLEALRPFLTEACLLAACRRHLEENGPQALSGVAYREVAGA